MTRTIHDAFEKTMAMAPQTPEAQGFWFSPEFRAGMMLLGFGMVSTFLLILSAVGGALGGFVRMRRNVSV